MLDTNNCPILSVSCRSRSSKNLRTTCLFFSCCSHAADAIVGDWIVYGLCVLGGELLASFESRTHFFRKRTPMRGRDSNHPNGKPSAYGNPVDYDDPKTQQLIQDD